MVLPYLLKIPSQHYDEVVCVRMESGVSKAWNSNADSCSKVYRTDICLLAFYALLALQLGQSDKMNRSITLMTFGRNPESPTTVS